MILKPSNLSSYFSLAAADRQVQMSGRLYWVNHPAIFEKKVLLAASWLRVSVLTVALLLSTSRLARLRGSVVGLLVGGVGNTDSSSESSFFAGRAGLFVGVLSMGMLANRNRFTSAVCSDDNGKVTFWAQYNSFTFFWVV